MHCRNCHASVLRVGFTWLDMTMPANLSELCADAPGFDWRHDV